MDMLGIASTSIAMQQAQLQQSVSISVTKKTMDSTEAQASSLLEMLPPPPTEYLIDVRA